MGSAECSDFAKREWHEHEKWGENAIPCVFDKRGRCLICELMAQRDAALARSETTDGLLPAESIALTVALAQTLRGDDVPPNTAATCVLALARLDGRHDWTEEGED